MTTIWKKLYIVIVKFISLKRIIIWEKIWFNIIFFHIEIKFLGFLIYIFICN